MSQISPPMRIVLGVAVAFLAVYMVVLRPKSDATPAPAPAAPAGNVHTGKPAVTSLGKAVQKAQGAVAATNAQQTKEGTDAGLTPSTSASGAASGTATASGSSTTKSTPAPAAPAIDTAGLPKDVARAIQHRKVLAVLFTNHRSADDRLTAQALHKVHRFDRRVFTKAVPLDTISAYGRIARGADVQQSPTVVVIDRNQKATTLVGYSDWVAIEQAVANAMRASGGIFTDNRFYSRLNASCSSVIRGLYAIPEPTTVHQYPQWLRRVSNRLDGFVTDVKAIPAPARFGHVKSVFTGSAAKLRTAAHTALGKLGKHPSAETTVTSAFSLITGVLPANRTLTRVSDRHGLIYCGRLG